MLFIVKRLVFHLLNPTAVYTQVTVLCTFISKPELNKFYNLDYNLPFAPTIGHEKELFL